MEVVEGLHPNKPATSISFKMYFLWLMKMPLLDLTTFNPRKKFN